jgi:hypothetical protein
MARPVKNYESGSKKRLQVDLADDDWNDLETIRDKIMEKFGKYAGTDANVTRAALKHYADHVRRGEVE